MYFFDLKRKFKKGQSLFEVLIAVFIISFSLITIISLASRSVGNATFGKERSIASASNKEAIEWLRRERDRSWVEFRNRSAAGNGLCYCLNNLNWNLNCGNCPPLPNTANLVRTATLVRNGANIVRADVVVSWYDADGQHESRSATYFSNWRTR